jgi:hypothetical protein
LFPLAWLCAVTASAPAQEVEVSVVKFSGARPSPEATGGWLEADIALNVRPAPGSPGAMVARVRVLLTLGFELPGQAGGERRIEHYRAEAECVALEPGRADVRFYLPPEIVKRDQLHGDPKYWGIELIAGGRPQLPGRAAYAASLPTTEQRKNFQAHAATAAAPNDGLLLPQYLTPFAGDYPRATPSFVRREPQ